MANKILLGGIAGGIACFLLGWVIYGVALKNFYDSQTLIAGVNKDIPEMATLIIANLAQGFLLALILGKWAKVSNLAEGMRISIIVGLLIGLSFDFIMYSTTNLMTMQAVLVDVLVTTVFVGIVGAIVTLIVRPTAKTVPA